MSWYVTGSGLCFKKFTMVVVFRRSQRVKMGGQKTRSHPHHEGSLSLGRSLEDGEKWVILGRVWRWAP